jgi:hypothetical protein
MKKLIIILMVVAVASFLFVGCIPGGVTPDPDPDPDPDPTALTTVAPIITSVPDIVGGYVNAAAAANGLVVNGTAPTYSEVKVYINGITAGTGDAGFNGVFSVVVANADLIKAVKVDGAKTLHATATEAGLAESASSNVRSFILDTVIPSIASSVGKTGTAAVGALIAEVGEVIPAVPGLDDTNDLFNNWAIADASLLVLGTWKLEIKAILDSDGSASITTGDTITVETTDPSGNKTSYSWGYPSLVATSNYTTFIPGVSVDFPETSAGVFNALTFADIGAEVFVAVTAVVTAVPGYIDVTFNEPVTGASILAAATTWTAFGATTNLVPAITVRSATVARLTETAAILPNLVTGVAYSVSVSGIIDLAGNPIPATAPSLSTGVVIP